MEWYKVKFLKIEKREIKTIGATGVEYELFWDGTTPVNLYKPIVVFYDINDVQIDTWKEINFKFYRGLIKKESFYWTELPEIIGGIDEI